MKSTGYLATAAVLALTCAFSVQAWGAITVGGDDGEVSPADLATWTSSTDGYVGRTDGKTGEVLVDGGSDLLSRYCWLGSVAGSTGAATVTGAGSTWASNWSLYVGHAGTGTLTVADGGVVSSRTGALGYASGSNGTAVVTGAGSTWNNSYSVVVGYSGSGSLTIENGARVTCSGNSSMENPADAAHIGFDTGSTGSVLVTGAGSTWTINGSDVYSHHTGAVNVGGGGAGSLTIADGGLVTSYAGYLGSTPQSSGTVVVTGTGSTWNNSGKMYVGYRYGEGSLTVGNGGTVRSTHLYVGDTHDVGSVTVEAGGTIIAGTLWAELDDLKGGGTINATGLVADVDLVFDAAHGLAQTLPFGTGGTLNLTPGSAGTLGVGYRGAGSLTVRDGKALSTGSGYLGYNGSSGTALISGAGSVWSNAGLYCPGTGSLTIENGGRVNSNSVGVNISTTFIASVRGAGSMWSNAGSLYVSGALMIADGGQVGGATTTNLRGTTTVAGVGSSLASGELLAGSPTGAALAVENGGQVSSSTAYIGKVTTDTATVTVRGAGSTWTNSTLYIGHPGSGGYTTSFASNGALVVADGAVVNSSTGYLGLDDALSTATALVTGAGATWAISGDLDVGNNGKASLTVDNGGTVSARTLFAAQSELKGNGTINVKGMIVDGDWVFDASRGASHAFGTGGTLNLALSSASIFGAGHHGLGRVTISSGMSVTSGRGYVGYAGGSNSTVTVTDAGSSWTTGPLHVNTGTLMVENGGRVASSAGYIVGSSNLPGAIAAAAIIDGPGSVWTTGGDGLEVGDSGRGSLLVSGGGLASSLLCTVGWSAGSTGTITVTGAGSTWNNRDGLVLGKSGAGVLTVADSGKVTTMMLTTNAQSAINMRVSGNGMLVLGNAAAVGNIFNAGSVNLYADAMLPGGAYYPITDYAGRSMTWSGAGAYRGIGGTWNDTTMKFTVAAATALASGTSDSVSTGERLLITDAASGERAGASFGAVTAAASFSASRTTNTELAGLCLSGSDSLLSAWDFTTDLSGQALLAFDVGLGAENLEVWQYDGSIWKTLAVADLIYDSRGIASFTTSSFGAIAIAGEVAGITGLGDFSGDGLVDQADYTTWADRYGAGDAVLSAGSCNRDGVIDQADYTTWADHYGAAYTTAVPEPATLAILVVGAAAMLRRRK